MTKRDAIVVRPLEWDEPQFCRDCGVLCPRARWCYAIPMCYDCLPPPLLMRVAVLADLLVGNRVEGVE